MNVTCTQAGLAKPPPSFFISFDNHGTYALCPLCIPLILSVHLDVSETKVGAPTLEPQSWSTDLRSIVT